MEANPDGVVHCRFRVFGASHDVVTKEGVHVLSTCAAQSLMGPEGQSQFPF